MGNVSSTTLPHITSEEMKAMHDDITRHVESFVNDHCEMAPQYFMPIELLKTGWEVYKESQQGLHEAVSKYNSYSGQKEFERISLVPKGCVLSRHKDFIYGVRMTSWPKTQAAIERGENGMVDIILSDK